MQEKKINVRNVGVVSIDLSHVYDKNASKKSMIELSVCVEREGCVVTRRGGGLLRDVNPKIEIRERKKRLESAVLKN